MAKVFDRRQLVPPGFSVLSSETSEVGVTLVITSSAFFGICPCCGSRSVRIQSRYRRHVADLPISGRNVDLRVIVRRFWCDAVLCGQRIFCERFDRDILAPWARRTGQLEMIVHHLGLALGGRPAAAFSDRLMMPVSNDTLLRVVRRRSHVPAETLNMIGIDDFAWKRNHRYGTIVRDLERRRTVHLLPDCEQATSQDWLAAHPSIRIVARDRGGGYGEAATKALPDAEQVADRWHLIENASRAFLDAVQKSMRSIRSTIGSSIVDPKLLTRAEQLQYDGYLRRQETNVSILALSKQGTPIRQIVKSTGHSRKLVRSVLRGQHDDIFRVRQSSLETYLPWLDSQWESGTRNATALWRHLNNQGFRGCLGVVSEWMRRRKRAEKADQSSLARTPSARTIARLMTLERDHLSKADTLVVAVIEEKLPTLVEARELIADFHQMVRTKAIDRFTPWITRASSSLVSSFASGVMKDEAAVRNAIVSPWSNGQTEGQITKLKLVKRQMYGRAKIDLLQARLIGAA
jgi:transposase